jgi:hypothetical protein
MWVSYVYLQVNNVSAISWWEQAMWVSYVYLQVNNVLACLEFDISHNIVDIQNPHFVDKTLDT